MPESPIAAASRRTVRRHQGPRGRSRGGRPRRAAGPQPPDPREPGARVRGDAGQRMVRRGRRRATGYAVEHPAGSLATAVRGRLTGGKGPDGPRIGILAEYDALPGLGHGCGHNTMAAQRGGRGLALAAVRDEWAGEVVFLGTPAEERGSGKEIMLRDGLFEGLDAALLFHPCDRNHVEIAPLASEDVTVVFTGLQSHAALGALGRQERPRRDDRPVRLGGPVAPAAAPALPGPRDHPGGRHGRQHHPGPDAGLVHDPKRRPGVLRRRHEAALRRAVQGRRAGRRGGGRGRVLAATRAP